MPATKKQVKQQRLKIRAENQEEAPVRRIRAAKSLLLLSGFTRDPSRLARKIANLFISDGTVTSEVREQAAKLLELVSSHAVNDSEPDEEDEVQMPAEFHIRRPKTRKAPKGFQEAILNGGDLYLFHYWEPEVGEGWPASSKDFESAKIKARDLLLPAIDQTRPRYRMEGGIFTTQRTDYGEEVLSAFKSLVVKILAAPAEHKEQPATPLASPTDYGVPVSLTRDQIVPRPDLSRPPELKPGEVNARATCSICKAGGHILIHDCMMFQDVVGATS